MFSTKFSAQSIPEKITKTIIRHKLIKPSSPTPPTQRWHNLSLTDQALSNSYVPIALFYTKEQLDNVFPSENPISDQLSSLLEDSLSKILSSYYPYAGRLKDNTMVDCNDMGAEFYQAEINCPISFAIEYHNPVIEKIIFPQGVAPWANSSTDDRGLVIAQLSSFKCGGIAISMSISHKIGDGCNASNLFNDWANITRHPNWPLPSLHYVQQSIFPSDSPLLNPVIKPPNMEHCVQRRLIFSTTKLDALKALVADVVQNPTRTEVVAGLLFKCGLAMSKNLQSTSFTYAIDLRRMVNLPPNCVGNLCTSTTPVSILKEENLTLPNIVRALREGKEQTKNRDNIKNSLHVNHIHQMASRKILYPEGQEYNVYSFSSLLNFPLHEIDFGWGKPVKVSMLEGLCDKFFYLLGNQSGGVDALLTLSERNMSIFERNTELLEFATLVPTC